MQGDARFPLLGAMMKAHRYTFYLTIFLGSTLLFALQPLMAKSILPWFGGGAGIWNLCQLFFQSGLLLGYFYAHGVGSRAVVRWVHPALFVACLIFLPVIPGASWKTVATTNPEQTILLLLTATVGLPYILLCSSSPLLADFYRRNFPKSDPYLLFAWSNCGSLLGLLSYPFLVEPAVGLTNQARLWSILFVLYAILASYLTFASTSLVAPELGETSPPPNDEDPPSTNSHGPKWSWVVLPALSSLILTAGTHHVSSELAPIPLLWCVPLSLYLLSYILVSSSYRIYRRPIFGALLLAAVLLFNRTFLVFTSPISQLIQSWSLMMVYFTVIHGELWEHRPAAERLTAFYLWMATGGAIGTFLASIAAPWLLVNAQEFAISVLVLPIVWWVASSRFLIGPSRAISGIATLLVTAISCFQVHQTYKVLQEKATLVRRNFYGRCIVGREKEVQLLFNGVTCHGVQFQDSDKSKSPTSYFSNQSGIGRTFAYLNRSRPQGVQSGVVGLGIGILASYLRPVDTMKFYEIDPKVIEIAKEPFRYLSQSSGKVETVQGDARIMLEGSQDRYDLLVIDAFSGDAIPTHLLNNEALALYKKHLNPNGILAFHISNRYLNLNNVVSTLVNGNGMVPLAFRDEGNLSSYIFPSNWVVALDPQAPSGMDGFQTQVQVFQALGFQVLRSRATLWTDDYTSLFEVFNL